MTWLLLRGAAASEENNTGYMVVKQKLDSEASWRGEFPHGAVSEGLSRA